MRARPPGILYGICGEGLGHFARASFLIPALQQARYRVEICTSGRVVNHCRERFPDCPVRAVPGLRMAYSRNRVNVARTMVNYAGLGCRGVGTVRRLVLDSSGDPPLAVISDYEPVVSWAAGILGVPLVALDHQQVATACKLERGAIRGHSGFLLRASNRMTYPRPDLRLMTSFFRAPLREGAASTAGMLVGPLLRVAVLDRRPRNGEHVVVYQTSRSLEWLDRILGSLPGEKRVYGAGPAQSGQGEKPFDEGAFLDDLASCRFAVVNAGHMTICEALHFGKPIICLPVLGQAEQEMNAHYVETLGVGCSYRPAPGDVPDFGDFLSREDALRETIETTREPCGNAELLSTVLGKLEAWAEGA